MQSIWHTFSGGCHRACFDTNICGAWVSFYFFHMVSLPSQLDSNSWGAHCKPATQPGQGKLSLGPFSLGKQEEVNRVLMSAEAPSPWEKSGNQDLGPCLSFPVPQRTP